MSVLERLQRDMTAWQRQLRRHPEFGFEERRTAAFAIIGNGADGPPLHNPSYDFNDAILADGARLLCAIARRRLAE